MLRGRWIRRPRKTSLSRPVDGKNIPRFACSLAVHSPRCKQWRHAWQAQTELQLSYFRLRCFHGTTVLALHATCLRTGSPFLGENLSSRSEALPSGNTLKKYSCCILFFVQTSLGPSFRRLSASPDSSGRQIEEGLLNNASLCLTGVMFSEISVKCAGGLWRLIDVWLGLDRHLEPRWKVVLWV